MLAVDLICLYSGKLSQIGGKKDVCRENFLGLLAGATKRYHIPKFREEKFTKRQNSQKFSPLNVSPYIVGSALV